MPSGFLWVEQLLLKWFCAVVRHSRCVVKANTPYMFLIQRENKAYF